VMVVKRAVLMAVMMVDLMVGLRADWKVAM
jgi:hypothetical protein